MSRVYSHYFKDVRKLEVVDVYRVLKLFDIVDPCIQHAVKKLLVAGGRGMKTIDRDILEAIATLERWKEMRKEDSALFSEQPEKCSAHVSCAKFNGSMTDLATDVAYQLTRQQAIDFMHEMKRFLDFNVDKFQGAPNGKD